VFFDRALDAGESMHIKLTEAMHEWAFGIFTKVVVGVESEEELFDIYDKTKLFGLPCAIIQDVGATEFNGVPTYTALAVGPAESEKIDKITGNLKLL
jgi:PTH2 family peptidyl-tRNA hydrolase